MLSLFKRKKKLSKKELDSILPVIKDFNSVAKHLIGVLNTKVTQKEQQVNVMISKIGLPTQEEHSVRVMNVDMSKSFLKDMKKKPNQSGSSEWDEGFSQKKGFII